MRNNVNSSWPVGARKLLLGALATGTFLVAYTLLISPAQAAPKVDICHIPPGNPANWHTIRISANAVSKHIDKHGDFLGACDDVCAMLCDDGNACTIDDNGDCEDNGCPSTPEVVDCNDSNPCTADSCEPTTGCENTNRTLGVDCTVDAPGDCDQEMGACDGAGSCVPDPEPGCCRSTEDCTAWDMNLCTIEECQSNACVKVSDVDCVDNNQCTTDYCLESTGECKFDDISDQCPNPDCHDNGCDPDGGCYSIRDDNCCLGDLECTDPNNCTTDSCVDQLCVHVPCATGDDCNVIVDCDPFTCEPTFESPCTIDDDPCTVQYCDLEAGGCVTEPLCDPEAETCNDGVCEPIEVPCFSMTQHLGAGVELGVGVELLEACVEDCEDRLGDCTFAPTAAICAAKVQPPYLTKTEQCLGGDDDAALAACEEIDQLARNSGCSGVCPPPPTCVTAHHDGPQSDLQLRVRCEEAGGCPGLTPCCGVEAECPQEQGLLVFGCSIGGNEADCQALDDFWASEGCDVCPPPPEPQAPDLLVCGGGCFRHNSETGDEIDAFTLPDGGTGCGDPGRSQVLFNADGTFWLPRILNSSITRICIYDETADNLLYNYTLPNSFYTNGAFLIRNWTSTHLGKVYANPGGIQNVAPFIAWRVVTNGAFPFAHNTPDCGGTRPAEIVAAPQDPSDPQREYGYAVINQNPLVTKLFEFEFASDPLCTQVAIVGDDDPLTDNMTNQVARHTLRLRIAPEGTPEAGAVYLLAAFGGDWPGTDEGIWRWRPGGALEQVIAMCDLMAQPCSSTPFEKPIVDFAIHPLNGNLYVLQRDVPFVASNPTRTLEVYDPQGTSLGVIHEGTAVRHSVEFFPPN